MPGAQRKKLRTVLHVAPRFVGARAPRLGFSPAIEQVLEGLARAGFVARRLQRETEEKERTDLRYRFGGEVEIERVLRRVPAAHRRSAKPRERARRVAREIARATVDGVLVQEEARRGRWILKLREDGDRGFGFRRRSRREAIMDEPLPVVRAER